MVLGAVLIALGLLVAVAGVVTFPGSTEALGIGFLLLMWGTVVVAVCVSNRRRMRASSGDVR